MKEERDYIVKTLQSAGVHGKIHDSMKSLKGCGEIHVGAVLRVQEKFTRSKHKTRYEDPKGRKMQRNKLFDRITTLHVVIADSEERRVEDILTEFLRELSKGFAVDGNWVDIDIGEADWIEKEDSILKSKVAVEFDLILNGGVYKDIELVKTEAGDIEAGRSADE